MTNPYSIPGQKTIEQAVCEEWGVTPEQLRSSSKKYSLPEARKVIVYYFMDIMKKKWRDAGAAVGKDHATAMEAYKKFWIFMEVDPKFKEKANRAISFASPKYTALSISSQVTGEMSYEVKLVEDMLVISFPGPVWGITMNKDQFREFVENVKKVVCVDEEII